MNALVLTFDSLSQVELVRNACATAANDARWAANPDPTKRTSYAKQRVEDADELRVVCGRLADIQRQNSPLCGQPEGQP